MDILFFICAVAGGSFLVIQFVLMILGLGDGDLDTDSDMGTDADVSGQSDSWFIGVLSVRTLTAAVTFFGLVGWAMREAEAGMAASVAAALVAGLVAMVAVYWLFRSVMKLEQDGTVHVENTVGKRGTVYIPIPGNHGGAGKVQMKVQNRIKEYQAVTGSPEKLPTGAKVVVISVVSGDTVEVEPILEPIESKPPPSTP